MRSSIFLLATLSFFVTGCQPSDSAPESVSSEVEPKRVMVSFYPLAFITEQIAGDKALVTNLAENRTVHRYKPSAQDMVALNQSDLVVYQGAELEPWAEGVIPELEEKGITVLEVSASLDLMKVEEHEEHEDHEDHEKEGHDEHEDHEEDHHDDDHEEHDEHEDHDEEGHDEHHHGEFDPHTWLDPVLAQEMTNIILDSLVAVDPANKKTYRANAKKLKAQFSALDKEFKDGLKNCGLNEVIISHDAFGYLTHRYDFEAHPIAGLSPRDEPSAQILAQLKEKATEGITHILVEDHTVKSFAETLAAETGLKMLPINPLEKASLEAEKNYFDIARENLQSFAAALQCQ